MHGHCLLMETTAVESALQTERANAIFLGRGFRKIIPEAFGNLGLRAGASSLVNQSSEGNKIAGERTFS